MLRRRSAPRAGTGGPAPTRQWAVHRFSPVDLTRALLWGAAVVATLSFVRLADDIAEAVGVDLADALTLLPVAVRDLALTVILVVFVALLLGGPIALLVSGRRRTAALGAAGVFLAAAAQRAAAALFPLPPTADWPTPNATTGSSLAMYVAATVIATPDLPRRWRRALWWFLGVLVAAHLATAPQSALAVGPAVAIGGLVGSLVLLLLGRNVRVWSAGDVAAALGNAGHRVDAVAPRERPPGDPWLFRAVVDGHRVLVKIVDEEMHQADTLHRAYRRLRLREVGDDDAYPSPRRAVSAEALVALYAATRGAAIPAVRSLVPMPADSVLLAVDDVEGRSLASLDPEGLTPAVLRSAWQGVRDLRTARVAHRALTLDNLLLDDGGQVWIRNLDLAQPAAGDGVLLGDVAELLAATYAQVGATPAVAAAGGVLGTDVLGQAIGRLVPAALTRSTRDAVHDVPGRWAPLRAELCQVTGIAEPELAKVERLGPRHLVLGAALGIAVYVLLPQLADAPRMVQAVADADWRWLAGGAVASILTYVGAGLALVGATPGRVPLRESAEVAVAGSFVATFAPPGLAPVGLNIRYLQQRGLPPPVAISASAAKEATVVVVHLLILTVVAVRVGRTGVLADELDRLPPTQYLVAGVAVAVVVVLASLATPRVRTLLRQTVVPAARESADALADVVRHPSKIAMLLIGVTLIPLGYASCLYLSLRACGGDLSFAVVALLFLTVGSAASAAPTPGGVGAVEAVLVASLTGVGAASAEALAAVFLFRLLTFWLPILPGTVAFRSLTARGVL